MRVIPWLKAKTTAQQQEYLLSTVRVLVYAAEQIYGAGRGGEKLQYVEDELRNRGFKLDTAAIEAAVRDMNLEQGWLTVEEEYDVIDESEE